MTHPLLEPLCTASLSTQSRSTIQVRRYTLSLSSCVNRLVPFSLFAPFDAGALRQDCSVVVFSLFFKAGIHHGRGFPPLRKHSGLTPRSRVRLLGERCRITGAGRGSNGPGTVDRAMVRTTGYGRPHPGRPDPDHL